MPWNVCRICLVSTKKMYTLAITKHLDIFEKLTGNKWETDQRPKTVCYVCFYLMMKYLKLREMSRQSEEIFAEFFASGFELTGDTVSLLNDRKLHQYLITPIQEFSVGVHMNLADVVIKKEDDNETNPEDSSKNVKEGNPTIQTVDTEMKNTNEDTIKTDTIDPLSTSANFKNEENGVDYKDTTENTQGDKVRTSNEKISPIKIKMDETKETQLIDEENEANQTMEVSKDIKTSNRNICFTLKFNNSTRRNTIVQNSQSIETTDVKNRKYICKYCGKLYKAKYSYEKHLNIHEANYYTCKYCSKKFNLKSVLKLHEAIHTKLKGPKLKLDNIDQEKSSKEYQCELCPKSFSQLCHLQQHIRIHTGERPYKCDVCKKRFKQLSNLTQHKRVHSGDKPFECNFCNKAFGQVSNLKQHKKLHHTEKLFLYSDSGE